MRTKNLGVLAMLYMFAALMGTDVQNSFAQQTREPRVLMTSQESSSQPESILDALVPRKQLAEAVSSTAGTASEILRGTVPFVAMFVQLDTNIGFLGERLNFSESVNNSQPKDIYRFTVNGPANFSLRLTGLTANADVDVRDASGVLVPGAFRTTLGTAAESLDIALPGRVGTSKGFMVTVYRVGSASTNYSLSLAAAEGWSNSTGYRGADTAVRRALRDAGMAVVNGSSSGRSLHNPSAWKTDVSDRDGERIRDAIGVFDVWRRAYPTSSVPQSIKDQMAAKLPTYQTDVNDAPELVGRIIDVYDSRPNGTPIPVSEQQTLDFIGALQQCYEWLMTRVQAADGTVLAYGVAGESDPTKWRPGMGLFLYNNSLKRPIDQFHSNLIVDIKWDATGTPVAFKFAEANWGLGWNHPGGMVPWSRTVSKSGEVSISGSQVRSKYFSVMNFK